MKHIINVVVCNDTGTSKGTGPRARRVVEPYHLVGVEPSWVIFFLKKLINDVQFLLSDQKVALSLQ